MRNMGNNYFIWKLKIVYQILCDIKTEFYSPFLLKVRKSEQAFLKIYAAERFLPQ